jgi:hypothetical protein
MHSPRQGPDAGTCEHGSKPPGFIRSPGFLDKLRDQQVLKNKYVHGITYSTMQQAMCSINSPLGDLHISVHINLIS